MEKKTICSICGDLIEGSNEHSSQPCKEGRCCDKCYNEIVKPTRDYFFECVMTGEL